MPIVSVTVHPEGLHPIEAVKAYHKATDQNMSVDEIIKEGELHNLSGALAGRKALYAAIKRVADMDRCMLSQNTHPPTVMCRDTRVVCHHR